MEWPENAGPIYQRIVQRYQHASYELVPHASSALLQWGLRLQERGLLDQALGAYERLQAMFGESDVETARSHAAGGLLNRAAVIGKLHGPEAELCAYEDLQRKHAGTHVPSVWRWLAAGARNAALTLRPLGRKAEARAMLERAIATYESATGPAGLREEVANMRIELERLE